MIHTDLEGRVGSPSQADRGLDCMRVALKLWAVGSGRP